MPTWSEILEEIKGAQTGGARDAFDLVRRKYLRLLNEHTKRNVLLYASAFTQKVGLPYPFLQVCDADIQGLMEVVHSLPKADTDVIIHSPGGSAEAAEAIVEYLHTQYPHIRAIVPQLAMSAATMIACGTNEIVMGKHSSLGPIDPQIYIPASERFEPAQAILEQFELAVREAAQPGMQAWALMLQMYGPALVVCCQEQIELSKRLVKQWLRKWMFHGDKEASKKARRIADFLGDHKKFLTHGRHVRREELESKGLKITWLEKDQRLQDLVLSVFHATTHTFAGTNAVKIIENHLGKAFINMVAPPAAPQPSP